MITLFDPIQVGIIQARNRIVMAPLPRNRAGAHQVPTPLMALYYEQRSSAGLIVSEAAQVAPEAQGYRDTPGIYSPAQIHGWRAVTGAVHAKGGAIVAPGRSETAGREAGGRAGAAISRGSGKTS